MSNFLHDLHFLEEIWKCQQKNVKQKADQTNVNKYLCKQKCKQIFTWFFFVWSFIFCRFDCNQNCPIITTNIFSFCLPNLEKKWFFFLDMQYIVHKVPHIFEFLSEMISQLLFTFPKLPSPRTVKNLRFCLEICQTLVAKVVLMLSCKKIYTKHWHKNTK